MVSKRPLAAAIGTLIAVSIVLSEGGVLVGSDLSYAHMEYVSGNRIFDEYGNEVMWRGVGGCYLLNSPTDYLTGWKLYMPYLSARGITFQYSNG